MKLDCRNWKNVFIIGVILGFLGSLHGSPPKRQYEIPQHATYPSISYSSTKLITTPDEYSESYIHVTCDSDYMKVKISSPETEFSGMVYPQGLSKNSSCLKEYNQVDTIEYQVPLRSCNTMMHPFSSASTKQRNIEEEFFNTIILEPHPKLVTGQGKGFQIRCTYKKHQINENAPVVTMKILRDGEELSGEYVKIGDPLVLNITVDSNHRLPFIVTNCTVRDGLGWAEEILINKQGCSNDGELMGQFTYSDNSASVKFLAHKFPYSPSVYYACAVQICKDCHPPYCDGNSDFRKRRDVSFGEPATVEVYDGIYVNEDPGNEALKKAEETRRERKASGAILCFHRRDFALFIAISGLILMIAVIVLIFALCIRRKFAKGSVSSGSSIYSAGYANTAYSQSS